MCHAGGVVTAHRSTATRSTGAGAAAAALLGIEAVGTALIWVPVPAAWMWIGAQIYAATGSLLADMTVAFLGFVGSTLLIIAALNRLDGVWVGLRRRAGHEQREGALSQIVVISATLGIASFYAWFFVLGKAYLIPFMPNQ